MGHRCPVWPIQVKEKYLNIKLSGKRATFFKYILEFNAVVLQMSYNEYYHKIFITCVASSERDCGIANDGLADVEGFVDPVLSSGFKPGKQSGICI